MVGNEHAEANDIKLKKKFNLPFVDLPEDDDEEETKEEFIGKIRLTGKSIFKPKCVDTKRNELPEDIKIMSGDIVRAQFQISPYDGLGSGITGKLAMVQLVEKKAMGGGADANAFAAAEEDDTSADEY